MRKIFCFLSRSLDRIRGRNRGWSAINACVAVGLLLVPTSVFGQAVDFEHDILPVLQQHCIDCHGPDSAESNFRLDSQVAALRGGDSGEIAIAPGSSDLSELIRRVTSDDAAYRMPPDDELSAAQLRQLTAWIDDADSWQASIAEIADDQSSHWSFQPIQRTPVPAPASHPIDAFVEVGLAEKGLSRSPAAARERLVRRAYLVMHGLPPSPQQVAAFVNDHRDNAWDLLIEELLASPRYGERMAAKWLDLVRFGETDGFETNRIRPNAWLYRDWVVDAFNSDKPYDQFIVEQLAGDAVNADVGTGFLVGGPCDIVKGANPELQLTQRADEMADMINTTGTAFLGLTLGCARCHNHKFDPVSQTDYYALEAVFAGVNHAERSLPLTEESDRQIQETDAKIADLRQALAPFVATAATRPPVNAKQNVEEIAPLGAKFVRFTIDATNSGQPCIDELEVFSNKTNVALARTGAVATSGGDFVHPLHKLEHINDGKFGNSHSWIASQESKGWVQIEFPSINQINRIVWSRDREGTFADRLPTVYRIEASVDGLSWTLVAHGDDRLPVGESAELQVQYDFSDIEPSVAATAKAQLKKLQAIIVEREQLADTTMVYAGTFSQPGPTHRMYRGDPTAPREPVAPAAIQSLTDLQLPADAPEQERRLAIARWIASADNPLTARVLVNRLWQFHFGMGIVDTPSDFGGNGTHPTHPELLDFLAAELIETGWSVKDIHRLILKSETWQQDSRPHAEGMAIDAQARYLWRFPARRLDAESIRDSILMATGKLDLQPGGPGFSAFEIEPENVVHYFPKQDFGPADWRRMIYMTRVRQERDAVFGVFDCPDFNQVVPRRNRSTTPLQALNLFNSRFVLQQAEFLIERLSREANSPDDKITLAYRLCCSREPTTDEVQSALAFIAESDWQQFARAMLNSNEFVFLP